MPPRLTTLYIDMNAFFASVEQHCDPSLRGRPVAIAAVDGESGACVAASYEAKAYGVSTGTHVREARRLCPEIVFLPSRHRLYVRYNLAVGAILDRFAELTRIRSVDEFQLALSGAATTPEGAIALVRKMKAAVAAEIGPSLRFSAGLGPNHLLAKIAGKLEKPDGCQWLAPENMPEAVAHLALDDLPGIAKGTRARLEHAGVPDLPALWRLDPRHARAIWGSVEGERFVRAFQGAPVALMPTERHGYGNAKVLSPANRDLRSAYHVGRWLVEKACARLRRDGRVARRFSLSIDVDGGKWSRGLTCEPSQDTAYFLRLHRQLWRLFYDRAGRRTQYSIGVHLGDVGLLSERPGDLLTPLAPATPAPGERVAEAVDQINRRFGRETISYGVNQPHPGFFERG